MSTGFIKLHFSSLQEGVPLRVDVIDRDGNPNGFLILRYALLQNDTNTITNHNYVCNSNYCSSKAAPQPTTAASAAVAAEARLPTLPSNFSLQQQQQQQFSCYRGTEPQRQQQIGGNRNYPKHATAKQNKKVRFSCMHDP